MFICSAAVADRIKGVGYEYIAYIATLRGWVGIMATWCITHRDTALFYSYSIIP